MRTKKKADWTYGRFEIRAKLPAGQGTWPAIWMLPSDDVYGGWANSGEIDIMEAVNLKAGGERQVHGTLHYGATWPNNVYSGSPYSLPNGVNPADDFHVYVIEWEQGEIRWYADGDHYATQTSSGWYTVSALNNPFAPFDQRFHMILNFAVGGNWPEGANNKGIDASVFPQEMLVDYVRVYQCTANPITGKGCATRDSNFEANPGNTPPAPSANAESMIFDGVTATAFQWGTYTSLGTVAYQLKNVGGEYGSVAEVTYNTTDGIGFFQTMAAKNLSRFKNILFDVRVISAPSNRLALQFRADCTWPCTSGNYPLPAMALNTWTKVQIPLSELATAGLNLSAVNTPFVLSPITGTAAGVVLQLDNIELMP
ncbi:MAG: family 16 glycosylhydrolase [Marinagarivorans sp.]|nr:family 16 glycosylhydrolase [Marinagarivorans sp.]